MPCGAAVDIKGLKSCVIEVSGELSMTSVWEAPLLLVLDEVEVPVADGVDELGEFEEHAPSAAARRPTAVTASIRLPVNGLFLNIEFPLGCFSVRDYRESPASAGAARDSRQHAAARIGVSF
jgi:hypothetical protein